jgi:hypothetical protein
MILTQGIYAGIPMDCYIADPAPEPSVSTKVIKNLVSKTPAHAYIDHPRFSTRGDDSTPRSDLGTLAHAMLFGGDKSVVVIDAKDWRKKETQDRRDKARADGKLPVLEDDYLSMFACVDSIKQFLSTCKIDINSGMCEHTLIWQEDGVWCRARPDWFTTGLVLDLKTTECAEPGRWIKSTMLNSQYYLQAVHYLCGLRELGFDIDKFVFLCAEIDAPYCCSLVGLSDAFIEHGMSLRKVALKKWKECLESRRWPGYNPDVHYAELPQYLNPV